MSIRKRGDRVWQITIDLGKNSEGKRVRKSKTVHGYKVDALKIEHEMKVEYGIYNKSP